MYSTAEVLEFVKEEDVKFIKLAFCDVFGRQKNISVMPEELPRAFEYGIAFDASAVEGFGDEAREYFEFLREHEDHLRILRYGYHLKSDNFSEQVVTDSLAAVTERVKAEVERTGDKFSAVLQGVDDPWDIALVELWRREVGRSAGENIRELNEKGRLF